MIERVYLQAKKANLDHVLVATDDERIYECVKSFNGDAVMTSAEIPTGTDRCREALLKSGIVADSVINIQGDEPFINPNQIDMVSALLEREKVEIATLVSPAKDMLEVENPNRVKAVLAKNHRVLYFSRAPIPYQKELTVRSISDYFIHLGIYGFKASTLIELAKLEQSSLEIAERLEQLRWLQNGYDLYAGISSERADAVDTPEDLQHLEKKFFL